jgi:V8-like Glu-specific endopeptidase
MRLSAGPIRAATAIVVCALAFAGLWAAAAAAAADSGRSPVREHQVHSRQHLRAYWSPRRMLRADPAPIPKLSGPPPGRSTRRLTDVLPSYVPSSVTGAVAGVGAAVGVVPAAASPSAQGTDTGSSTVFPNSANGLVFFSYGSEDYQCSGSVVNTPAGRAVLTAGHCVIAPGSGVQATNIAFVPGYRDGSEPYGEWPATSFATTSRWQSTAGTGNSDDADEAGDMAILTLANRPSDGASVQSVVGAVGIGFNQPRQQTYNEYGYPAQFPYDGSRLYRLTAPWATDDSSFSPAPMGIDSDFTPGSSGGPWLVGDPPVALSISTYRYIAPPQSDYMFGPYFGSLAQQLYSAAGGTAPVSATKEAPPSNRFSIKRLTRNRQRGFAILSVEVPGPGRLTLRGDGLRTVGKRPSVAGIVKLAVQAGGAARQDLRDTGRLHVEAALAYVPSGGLVNRKVRGLTLIRRG